MAPIPSQAGHSHRSTTKINQKAFKTKHWSKGALKEKAKGKIEGLEKGTRKTPSQQVATKLARRNQAKQKRITQSAQLARTTNIFAGKDGAPRVVAVVPLTTDVDADVAVKSLNESVEVKEEDLKVCDGMVKVFVERFKQNVAFCAVERELLAVLEVCRAADFVVLVVSAKEEVDEYGELILRSIEGQGISNVVTVVQGLDAVEPAKKRPQVAASLRSFITHFFPAIEKVNSLDSRQECLNVVRSLCSTVPRGIRWREERSWMAVESVQWPSSKQPISEDGLGEVILTGVVRGKGLKADRLVQVGDWGDFQIEKITAAPLKTKKPRVEAMAVDGEEPDALLAEPSEDRDTLEELAPEEIVMDDMADYAVSLAPTERKGVLLDDHHYFSDEETKLPENAPRRLPRGTSKYQAAWFIDDMSDDGSDLEDVDEEMDIEPVADRKMGPADGVFEDTNMREPTEFGGPSEYPQSEMFLDPSPEDEAEQIAAYRASRKEEAADDLEFPDEVELEPNVLARERLIKYRGLKSLKTSQWETEEDRIYEPTEWRRLLEIADYKNAKNRITKEASQGGIQPGTRVNIHLRDVPLSLQQSHSHGKHLSMFSLLRHEHKRTAVNYSITLKSDLEAPIRSKTEMIMQVGPRRFVINPLFSDAGNTSNDVHKFQRYLHPGRTAIASFIAPLTWGSVPALFFRRSPTTHELSLIGTGTSLPPSHNRVIAKRIVLTGAPYKIHKKVVTVRYMFFNAEDVAWFKALQLWTRRGRSGFIRDSLGTHGYYKAAFDGKINPQDAVAVSLYKRVWPRQARVWKGRLDELANAGDGEGKEMDVEETPELVRMGETSRVFGP
ncbi:hypothetical protein EG327_002567 [Venturia inaequalis]|uniref:Bms1-type G domain-containing protein n=1 Tax=Venturia inaequalis TaxID=5025 RepID=A0A8H3VKW9_VENIN|nr:hypothetical protein EG327_002567 [Venturia inaequalis]